MQEEEVSCIGRRPCAPSPPSGLSLVPFEDVTPSPSTNEWLNSPSRIHVTSPSTDGRTSRRRVQVLTLIGDLLDSGLIKDQEAMLCIGYIVQSPDNVLVMSDLLEARKDVLGKARFVKLFLASRNNVCGGDNISNHQGPSPQCASTPIVPATIFDCHSSLDDNAVSPVPLVYPKAIRIATMPLIGAAVWPCVRGNSTEPKESPESAKSTNPGSSIEISPPNNTLSLTRETTACSNTSPPKAWSEFVHKCGAREDIHAESNSTN
jgi:hypothetical protein